MYCHISLSLHVSLCLPPSLSACIIHSISLYVSLYVSLFALFNSQSPYFELFSPRQVPTSLFDVSVWTKLIKKTFPNSQLTCVNQLESTSRSLLENGCSFRELCKHVRLYLPLYCSHTRTQTLTHSDTNLLYLHTGVAPINYHKTGLTLYGEKLWRHCES